MRIVRKINNSAAVAQDSRGKELIVIGKGIGFPAVPYELTDMSRIDRTFYDIDPRYFEMISTLPQEILLASADITEDAQVVLNTTLNSAADTGRPPELCGGALSQRVEPDDPHCL